MKPAGLLGCGSILHAACREDEETAEPSKFLALEVPLEGGGQRDGPGRALLPLNQLQIAPHSLHPWRKGLLADTASQGQWRPRCHPEDTVKSAHGKRDREGVGSTHPPGP